MRRSHVILSIERPRQVFFLKYSALLQDAITEKSAPTRALPVTGEEGLVWEVACSRLLALRCLRCGFIARSPDQRSCCLLALHCSRGELIAECLRLLLRAASNLWTALVDSLRAS